MGSTLHRRDGFGTDPIAISEAVRRKNYRLSNSKKKKFAAETADRIVACLVKLREWLTDQNCTIRRFAEVVGCAEVTAMQWLRGRSRPLPVWRVRIERATHGSVKASEWSTEREVAEAQRFIEHYETEKKKLIDKGSYNRRREQFRDPVRMRLYCSYVICGKDIPHEIKAFVERSPLGSWKQTGPA